MKKTTRMVMLLLLALLALFSCNNMTETTGKVRLYVKSADTRTIMPDKFSDVVKYDISLTSKSSQEKKEFNNLVPSDDGSVELTGITMGTYTVSVIGYDEYGTKTCTNASDTADLVIKPGETSSLRIQMEALYSEGTGSLEVTFDWSDLGKDTATPFNDALKDGSLTFQLLYIDYDEDGALSITKKDTQTVDVTDGKTSYTFTANNLEATKGQTIAFNILDKDGTVVAYKKFSSVLQIAAGQTSSPDENDSSLFYITNETAPSYVRNIYGASWTLNEDNPQTSVIVSWKNPASGDDVLIESVVLYLDAEGKETIQTAPIKVTSATTSYTFQNLEAETQYTLSAQAFYKDGRASVKDVIAFDSPITTKIPVEAITFEGEIQSSIECGAEFSLSYVFTPSNASIQTVTWTFDDTVLSQEGNTFTAIKPGETTVKVTSTDNPEAAAETNEITVHLAKVTGVSASVVEDAETSSIYTKVSWNESAQATGYKVYRYVNGGKEASPCATVAEGTSYEDHSATSGNSYQYSVVATFGETDKYDSAESELSGEIAIGNPSITIIPPTAGSQKLEVFGGNTIVIPEGETRTIGLANEIEGAVNYCWYINDIKLLSEGKEIVVGANSAGIDTSTITGQNELKLCVQLENGTSFSATTTFYIVSVLEEGIESPWQTEKINRLPVTIGDTLKIDADVTPENTTLKALSFYSDNPEIATVDQDGNLTVKGYDDVTITVKSISGKTIDISFSFYNPTVTSRAQIVSAINGYLNTYFGKADEQFKKDWRGNQNAPLIKDDNTAQTYEEDGISIKNSKGTSDIEYTYGKLVFKDITAELKDIGSVTLSTDGITLIDEGGSYIGVEYLKMIGNAGETIFVTLPDNQGTASVAYNNIEVHDSRGGSYIVTFSQMLGNNGGYPDMGPDDTDTTTVKDAEGITQIFWN